MSAEEVKKCASFSEIIVAASPHSWESKRTNSERLQQVVEKLSCAKNLAVFEYLIFIQIWFVCCAGNPETSGFSVDTKI
jgi:hypothetical protein